MADLQHLLAARKAAEAEGNTAAVRQLDQRIYESQGYKGGNTNYDHILAAINQARKDGNESAVNQLQGLLAEEHKLLVEQGRERVVPRGAEGFITAFGENARQGIRQAAGVLGLPDSEIQESSELNKPLNKANPWGAALGHMSVSVPPQVVAGQFLGPAAPKTGFGNALGRVAATVGTSAAGGALFSNPGERGSNALMASVLSAGPAVVGEGFKAFGRSADMRANRLTHKLMNPSQEELKETVNRVRSSTGNPYMSIKDVRESEGALLRKYGLGNWRLDDSQREIILRKLADEGASGLNQVLNKADSLGATVNRPNVWNKIQRAIDEVYPPQVLAMSASARASKAKALSSLKAVIDDPAFLPGTPVSTTEATKRFLQAEAKLAEAAKVGGTAPNQLEEKFLTKLSGIFKDSVEEAITARDPALGKQFVEAKRLSGFAQRYAPMAFDEAISQSRTGLSGYNTGPVTGATPQAAVARGGIRAVQQAARPYMVGLNEKAAAAYNAIPQSSDDALLAAFLDALRNK